MKTLLCESHHRSALHKYLVRVIICGSTPRVLFLIHRGGRAHGVDSLQLRVHHSSEVVVPSTKLPFTPNRLRGPPCLVTVLPALQLVTLHHRFLHADESGAGREVVLRSQGRNVRTGLGLDELGHRPIGLHVPGGGVLQRSLQAKVQLALQQRVFDGSGHLHPPHKVASHPVRGADEVEGLVVVVELDDTVVLKEAPDDGHHADVVGPAWDARSHAADAPHNQIDLHASLGRLVQLGSQHRVVDAVHLAGDFSVLALGGVPDLLVNQTKVLRAHGGGRHEQLAEGLLPVVACEVLEQIHHVRPQPRVARQ
mmetsp:Transcript_19462/g.37282  ORF Transcript_19462/g.37282 Transcript_19462/m.37282 type:complete len:310 (+) Transcript_19462:323-1252(+)